MTKFIDKYNWCGIKYPPDLNDFRRFENKNKDISLTIFRLEQGSKNAIISYHTKNQDRKHDVKLITITDSANSHYLAITSISKLFRGSTKHNGDFHCTRFINSFETKNWLDEHIPICKDFDYYSIKMPTKSVNDYLEFNDYHMAVMQPFMMYADFDCYNERV